jgi:hypothetical protein
VWGNQVDKNTFENLLNSLKDDLVEVLSAYDLDFTLEKLASRKFDKIESYEVEFLDEIFRDIEKRFGADRFELFRKLIIVNVLLNSWNDIFSDKYPICIQEQYRKTFQRILSACSESGQGWRKLSDDIYWKDLALTSRQMFPAGAQIVETYSGFGVKQGLSRNISQTARFVRLLLFNRGRRGYYQIHTHTPDLGEFNAVGWDDCYVRIAAMLEKYSNVKGMFGCSWFYDPNLRDISPNLMYLQAVPLENGAESFYVGEDRTGYALLKSKTRFSLYNEGKYTPRAYLIVWPRKEILYWAKGKKLSKGQTLEV